MNKKIVIIIVIAITCIILPTFTLSAFAARNPNRYGKKWKQNKGITSTPEIGIYSDSQCTNPLHFINWGMLEPGLTKNTSCYIKNEGNTVLHLYMKTSNWIPRTAFKDVEINWDYDGQPLTPGETTQITLILTLSTKTELTKFKVNINLIAG